LTRINVSNSLLVCQERVGVPKGFTSEKNLVEAVSLKQFILSTDEATPAYGDINAYLERNRI
jgi:hypothetical protein